MVSHSKMQQYVDQINSKLLVHALWNGYKIRMFKRKNLVIGGSQDWIYYHNIDVIFKKVTFFNLPDRWHDTAIQGADLFRSTNLEEFKKHHPNFDTQDRHIFAFDLAFDLNNKYEKHIYYVVAANVFLNLPENLKDIGEYIMKTL
jgi:hypothetical protein